MSSLPPMSGSEYDAAYFDHWYRGMGFGAPARTERKARYAIAAAEYLLERPVRSVLDVGCGEGQWQPALQRVRPGARYVGVDPSEYAVARYGRARNLRLGTLATLDALDLRPSFDLVVCCDVLGYANDRDVRTGLSAIAARTAAVALIEVFVAGDAIEGDVSDYRLRRAATYDRWFAEAGLHRIGPHLYVDDHVYATLARFERAAGGPAHAHRRS